MTKLALWERPVTYAAVGATLADDLLQYPPRGYRPIERRVRLGHGENRWDYAWTTAFTWGIQRMAGMRVEKTETPAEVSELTYVPVGYAADGTPVTPATVDSNGESLFGPDGTPFLAPGDTAVLHIRVFGIPFRAPVRVVYVVDEPSRKGFGYGTLPGHPESGEESWIVERSDDGSVWLNVRAFSRPANSGWWMLYPALRILQSMYTRRYTQVLAGRIAA
ncbi:MAG: hypothetical protein JWR53_1598 [Glaciihabitans sp.]|jgi:uncharacterized protein (UPF0548 family)|nr:hypothetical protein [Glaciihabitans sp.]